METPTFNIALLVLLAIGLVAFWTLLNRVYFYVRMAARALLRIDARIENLIRLQTGEKELIDPESPGDHIDEYAEPQDYSSYYDFKKFEPCDGSKRLKKVKAV